MAGESNEHYALRKSSCDVIAVMSHDVNWFAGQLLQEDFFTMRVFSDITSMPDTSWRKATRLLEFVYARTGHSSKSFWSYISILEKEGPYEYLAKKLQNTWGKLLCRLS